MTSGMKLLVTGGCGFIGSNLVHLLLRERPDLSIVVVDKLTYAGNLENLARALDNPRLTFLKADICDVATMRKVMAGGITHVLHLAAESHVDRSIEDATSFLATNVVGTHVLLDAARRSGIQRFVQVGTDEVYGSLEAPESATPTSALRPSSPYSASKAASDLYALACHHTYGFDVVVTRCTNNYGPFQFPEKLIPLMLTNALEGKTLPVYGDGQQVRDWIHVEDHCRGLLASLEKGTAGAVYHFGGRCELTNLDLVGRLLDAVGQPRSLMRHVADRPGHDRRYSLDVSLSTKNLGWEPLIPFDEGLASTIAWYQQHADWWQTIKSGAYRDFYERTYADRG